MPFTLDTRSCFAACAFSLFASVAHAHGYAVGDIAIAHPYAIATPAGAANGAGYIKELSNQGSGDDRLTGASSPAAERVELHSMTMDGDMMRMREVPAVVIPAHGRVDMTQGKGYHLMLIGIRQPLRIGDRIPVRLTFEKAGAVDVELTVQERGATGGAMGGAHRH